MGERKKQPEIHSKTIQNQKISENTVWDYPGGSWGRLGDQFGPRAAQGSKRAPKSHETLVRFLNQNGDPVHLVVGFF